MAEADFGWGRTPAVIHTRSDEVRPPYIVLPLGPWLVASVDPLAPDVLATVPAGAVWDAVRFSALNTTGSAATVSIWAVPAGGTAGPDNAELVDYSIPGSTAVDVAALVRGLYGPGTVLMASASATGAIQLRGVIHERR